MGVATVWEFVPLAEYDPPQPGAAVLGLDPVNRKSVPTRVSSEAGARDRSLPLHDDWIRPIDWQPAANAFDSVLDAWSNDGPRKGFAQVCVGSLGSAEQVLKAWVAQRRARVLDPPAIDALFNGSAELWPILLDDSQDALVIPTLERCFIRHHKGLRLVRQLVETVWATPRRLVIGCDIWAWKFLRTAAQIDAVCPTPVSVTPLDADRLRAWVPTLTAGVRDIRFVVEGEDCFAPESKRGAQLLRELAAASRGVPTLAWSLWQALIQHAVRKPAGKAIELHLTSPIPSPALSQAATESRVASYLLHAILLHGGLHDAAMDRLLPFQPGQVWRALTELLELGLVTEEQGLWRVAVKHYYEACRQLASAGFWVGES